MKRTQIYISLAIVFSGALSLWAVLEPTHTAAAIDTIDQSWTDDFSSPTLDSRWSWMNEDPTHWSLTAKPGYLRITTQSGSLFSGIYNNLLVTDAPFGSYQITSRVSITPTENFQGASIVVYGDNENYCRIARRFAGTGGQVNLRCYEGGSMVDDIGVDEPATSVYLRLTRVGDTYEGYYSPDGNSYQYVGQVSATIPNPMVGIVSENGPSTTEIQSDYDSFQLEDQTQRIFLPLVAR